MTHYAFFNFDINRLLSVIPGTQNKLLHEEFCKAWLVTLKTASMLREMFDEVRRIFNEISHGQRKSTQSLTILGISLDFFSLY